MARMTKARRAHINAEEKAATEERHAARNAPVWPRTEVLPKHIPFSAFTADLTETPLPGANGVQVTLGDGKKLRLTVSDDGSMAKLDTPDGALLLIPHTANLVVVKVFR